MFVRVIPCLVFALSVALTGCGDDSGSGSPNQPISRGDGGLFDPNPVRPDAAPFPTNPGDGGVSADGSVQPIGGECTPGETRCPQERAAAEERCRPSGVWAVSPCSAGEICIAGGCVPDPAGCSPGERTCLGDGSLAECQNDDWVPSEACPMGTECLNGDCLSQACTFAARSASYLGCDYLAVDFPNNTFKPGESDGTPDSPLGVVVGNTSPTEAVTVNVFGPDGAAAALVGSQVIPIPGIIRDNPLLGAMYQSQTVSSEVRDSSNNVIQSNIALGSGIQVPPGGTATLLIPRRIAPFDESSLRNDAYRVTTDYPVVAYQFSPYCCNYSFSNDASLLLPTTALGTEYRYVGVPLFQARDMFGNVRVEYPAMIAVVSPSDQNRVTVRLPAGANILPDSTGQVVYAGGRTEVVMNEQDVLLVASSGTPSPPDLTGSVISAEKPVSVFSTHTCSNYPSDQFACDHLQEQLFPVSTWGRRFQLVPVAERNQNWPSEVTYWKLVGSDSPTRFEFSVPFAQLNPVGPGYQMVPYCANLLQGDTTVVVPAGQSCEFGTKRAVEVVSDQPAMVMGIIAGQEATGLRDFGSHAGDPAIFLVPPDEQFRREYTFLAPDTYFVDYVTIVTPPGNEILLDDQPVQLNDAVPVAGSILQYKHVVIGDGVHRLQGRAPFGIVVYAYDDFVSYAFTGGLNLTKR